MKLVQERQGWHAAAIRSATVLSAIASLYLFAILAIEYLPKYGLPPCESPTNLLVVRHGLEALLIIISILLLIRVGRRPNYATLLAAFMAVVGAGLIQEIGNRYDVLRQQKCESRSLDEAMKACAANPAVYLRGTDHNGYGTLTLIAPGNTDGAWNCLNDWGLYNGDISFKVDESVYQAYRNANNKAP